MTKVWDTQPCQWTFFAEHLYGCCYGIIKWHPLLRCRWILPCPSHAAVKFGSLCSEIPGVFEFFSFWIVHLRRLVFSILKMFIPTWFWAWAIIGLHATFVQFYEEEIFKTCYSRSCNNNKCAKRFWMYILTNVFGKIYRLLCLFWT